MMGYLTYICSRYGAVTKQQMGDWIHTNRKLITLKEQRTFLIRCRNNDLFPSHIQNNLKRYNVHNLNYNLISKFQKTKTNFQTKCLRLEIENIVKNIQRLGKFSNYLKYRFLRTISDDSINKFLTSQEQNFQKLKISKRNDCIKKFDLLKNRSLTNNKKISEFRLKNCFKNLSNVEIPDDVAETLALGNKFGVPINTNNIPINSLIANIENSIKNIKDDDMKFNIRKTFTNLVSNHTNNNKFKNLEKSASLVKKFQKEHKDLIFLNADKGNLTVAANRNEYNITVENI